MMDLDVKFYKFYGAIKENYEKKNWNNILEELPTFGENLSLQSNMQPYNEGLIKIILFVIRDIKSSSNTSYKYFYRALIKFLNIMSTNCDYKSFLEIINRILKFSEFTGQMYNILKKDCNSDFLRIINREISKISKHSTDINDCTMFSTFSESLLLFASYEMEFSHEYTHTNKFLEIYMQFSEKSDAIEQSYLQSYRHLLQCFQYQDAVQMGSEFVEFTSFFTNIAVVTKSTVNEDRIRLLDLIVTISRLINARLHPSLFKVDSISISTEFAVAFFEFIHVVYNTLKILKCNYSKSSIFCTKNCRDYKMHELDNITTVAYCIFRYMFKKSALGKRLVLLYNECLVLKCIISGSLKCEKKCIIMNNTIVYFENTVRYLATVDADYGIFLLDRFCQILDKITVPKLRDKTYIFEKFFCLYYASKIWNDCIKSLICSTIFLITEGVNKSSEIIDSVKKINNIMIKYQIETEHKHILEILELMNWTYHGILIPKVPNHILLLYQLNGTNNLALKRKIIKTILNDQLPTPLEHLRVLYFYDGIPYTFCADIVTNIFINLMRGKDSKHRNKSTQISLVSIQATYATFRYMIEFENNKRKCENMCVGHSIDYYKILSENNVHNEKTAITFLLLAAKKCLKFVRFYCCLSDTSNFSIEAINAGKLLKTIGRQLILHDYKLEAVKVYFILYQLSTKVQDECNIYEAVSNFLSHFKIFNFYFESENLDNIVENCYSVIVERIRNTGLSQRNNISVFSCLSNIIKYYLSHSKLNNAITVLKFYRTCLKNIVINENYTGVIGAEYYSLLFAIWSEYGLSSQLSPTLLCYNFMQQIKISGCFTGDESTIILLLFESFEKMCRFLIITNESKFLESYVKLVLKYSLKMGLALQTSRWMLIQCQLLLHEENYSDCLAQLKLLNLIYRLDSQFIQNDNVKHPTVGWHFDMNDPVINNSLPLPDKRVVNNIEIPLLKYIQSYTINSKFTNIATNIFGIASQYVSCSALQLSNNTYLSRIFRILYEFWINQNSQIDTFSNVDQSICMFLSYSRMLQICTRNYDADTKLRIALNYLKKDMHSNAIKIFQIETYIILNDILKTRNSVITIQTKEISKFKDLKMDTDYYGNYSSNSPHTIEIISGNDKKIKKRSRRIYKRKE